MDATDAESSSAASNTQNYRAHLDGLRSVAVYLVVAFHAGLSKFRGGFIGVDVFFVLSGYLVTGILLRDLEAFGRVDLRRFYARRFRRILPAAAIVLLVTAFAYGIVTTRLRTFDSIGDFRASFLYVANWHFIHEASNYFAPHGTASPVLHFWSLAVEEQFYFVWPLAFSALFVLSRRAHRSQWWVLRALVGAIALMSLLRAITMGSGDANFNRAYYGTDTRVYQLLAGALLALTPQLFKFGARYVRVARVAAGIALGGLILIGTSRYKIYPITRGVYAVGLTFLLIVALERSRGGIVRRALSDTRVAYLGRISYATYLWHWPIIVLMVHSHPANPRVLFAVTSIGATALAALSYHFVEHPIRVGTALNRYPGRVIAGGLAISAVAGLVIAPTILLSHTNGFTNAKELSVSEPDIGTGKVKLLDWRNARDDIPALPECFEAPVEKCVVVHGRGPRVLLMGDSISRMWLPAFTAIADRESLTLAIAALPACPWQRGLSMTRMAPECPKHRDDWYDRVVPAFDPDIVVLAERMYDSPGEPFHIFDSGQSVLVRSPPGEKLMERHTELTLEALKGPGRKILVLGSPPLPPGQFWDPEGCLAEGGVDCDFRVDAEPTDLDRYYRKVADDDRAVFWLDLDRLACPRLPTCDPVVNDIIVRRDHNHLTGTYALALSDEIEALLHRHGILPEAARPS